MCGWLSQYFSICPMLWASGAGISRRTVGRRGVLGAYAPAPFAQRSTFISSYALKDNLGVTLHRSTDVQEVSALCLSMSML